MRSILSAVLVLLLASCEPGGNVDTATMPPSAIVETREGPSESELSAPTRIVMLGTGTPIPDASRAGASVAIIHKGQAYLFDIGAGAVHNATRARYRHGIPSLYPSQICCLFVTHMHSDHTLDFAELVYTLWWRRPAPLRAFGPAGMLETSAGMHAMMAPDVRTRTTGAQPVANPENFLVEVTEIGDGYVFRQDDLRIEAFEVDHGDIKPAFGYRVDAGGRSIVISGDTTMSDSLLQKSRGVDVLIHEVISDSGLLNNSEAFQAYHRRSHTTATDLARLASEARPGLLVLYHGLYYGVPEAHLLEEVKAGYDGPVVLANDLDLF
ncbi:MAG TPA: MBL fold metallo-hydrolase [Woeseiaceae bacterium]|nr:MBL fold metallo-hydrolase [Woeseiaceae bacterium]